MRLPFLLISVGLYQVVNGPQVCVRLRANVAVPELLVSSDMIDFDTVPCGQCKVVTIQLYNEQYVKCEWTVVSSESQQTLASYFYILKEAKSNYLIFMELFDDFCNQTIISVFTYVKIPIIQPA